MCGYSFDINVQMFKLQIFKNLTDNVKIHSTQKDEEYQLNAAHRAHGKPRISIHRNRTPTSVLQQRISLYLHVGGRSGYPLGAPRMPPSSQSEIP